jgi:hypothetical protein
MFRSSLSRLALLATVPLGAAGLAVALPALPASAAGPCTTSGTLATCTYGFTGAEQTFSVPSGVTSVSVTATGAAGAPSFGSPAPPGGEGAQVTGTLTGLTSGEVLYVEVGGVPTTTTTACAVGAHCIGGFNGGGSSLFGGGGGGASDVRTTSSADAGSLNSRLIVAAGGGGGGEPGLMCDDSGTAGGNAGAAGPSSDCAGIGDSVGGGPGTQTAGGAGGSPVGAPGTLGVGGAGGGEEGGAGGGGLYGGGGGGGIVFASSGNTAGAGGGGGSSLVPSGGTESLSSSSASVVITYTVVPPLSVTTTSLPGGQVGSVYGPVTLAATGGVTPYSWSVTSGSLPPGLSLSTAGVISGTPTAHGTYGFTVTVSDSETPAMTASQPLSIVVKPAPLAVTTTSLPAAAGGQPYSATLAATGGIPPYSWSVTSGSLPPGLTLSTAGVISGTPHVAGTYSFTVTVSDSESPAMTASATFSISVSGPVITGLQPASGRASGGTSVVITGTGLNCPPGAAGCHVTVTFGGRPALVIAARGGEIVAISPPGSGTVTVTVTVNGVSSQATAAGQFTYTSVPFAGVRP